MCGRYLLQQEHLRSVLTKLGIPMPPKLPPNRFNIPPGGGIPAIRARPSRSPASDSPQLEVVPLHWGLIPSWAKSADQASSNARSESLADRPSFREAYRHRRCLIPASGFYEWKTEGSARQPWLFQRSDHAPFGLAGLWETWRAPDGTTVDSCAVITTEPNSLMAPIHHRMPVIIADQQWEAWLSPARIEAEDLSDFIRPWPSTAMTAKAVASAVNQVSNDSPACLNPAEPQPKQLGLAL